MADYSITPGLVKPSSKADIKRAVGGATLTAGTPIYLDENRRMQPSDANGSVAARAVDGIALTGTSEGQPGLYAATDPEFDLGVTVANGETVILSANAGKLAPNGDAASGWRKVVVGVGIGGTKINLSPIAGGVVPS